MLTSIELADERGAFPAIQGSIYDPARPDLAAAAARSPRTSVDSAARPWIGIESWKASGAHGIRNAAQTTVAPTGTIATVAGCEGYGCEPVFALAYYPPRQ